MINFSRFFFLFLVCSGTQLAQGQGTDTSMRLSVQEFAQKMREFPDAPIIDIRTSGEYAQGHLVNAVNVDWYASDFTARMAAFDKDQPVLLYCRSGNRSGQALTKLKAAGFKRMFELRHGILAWIEEGLPQSGH